MVFCSGLFQVVGQMTHTSARNCYIDSGGYYLSPPTGQQDDLHCTVLNELLDVFMI